MFYPGTSIHVALLVFETFFHLWESFFSGGDDVVETVSKSSTVSNRCPSLCLWHLPWKGTAQYSVQSYLTCSYSFYISHYSSLKMIQASVVCWLHANTDPKIISRICLNRAWFIHVRRWGDCIPLLLNLLKSLFRPASVIHNTYSRSKKCNAPLNLLYLISILYFNMMRFTFVAIISGLQQAKIIFICS